MLVKLTTRVAVLCFCVGFLGLLAGCNPKDLYVSVTDRAYTPPPPPKPSAPPPQVTEARAEPPAPAPMEQPRVEPSPPPPMESAPAPIEEVRAVEPPIPPPAPAPEPPPVVAAVPPPAPESPAPPPAKAMTLDDIFFDYDRFAIRGDAKPVLEANAVTLKAESGKKILIEGHCDERGTVEYNLVLGEKRARAAKQYLEDLGIVSSRIQITSYGKEKPFCTEHKSDCWQQNRRAHFLLP